MPPSSNRSASPRFFACICPSLSCPALAPSCAFSARAFALSMNPIRMLLCSRPPHADRCGKTLPPAGALRPCEPAILKHEGVRSTALGVGAHPRSDLRHLRPPPPKTSALQSLPACIPPHIRSRHSEDQL